MQFEKVRRGRGGVRGGAGAEGYRQERKQTSTHGRATGETSCPAAAAPHQYLVLHSSASNLP